MYGHLEYLLSRQLKAKERKKGSTYGIFLAGWVAAAEQLLLHSSGHQIPLIQYQALDRKLEGAVEGRNGLHHK